MRAPRRLDLALPTLVALAALAGPAPTAEAVPPTSPEQRAKRVDIDVHDADVQDVLRLLADTAGVNLVVAPEVAERVTLRLRNVRWDAALRATLTLTGLGMTSLDGVLLIDRRERQLQRSELARERSALAAELAPLVTRIIPVRYARAADLEPLVASLLSPRGRVQVDERTNTLIVTDVAGRAQRVTRTLGSADDAR